MHTPAWFGRSRKVVSGSSILSTLLLLAVAVVLAGSLWVLRWDTTMQKAYPDTFWYTRQAATMSGFPTDQAEEIAARTSCKHGQPMVEGWPNCEDGIRGYAAALPERYNRIPETRPGYPLVAAPFVAAFHEQGMVIATALLGGVSGMLVALAVRLLGGSAVQSLFATVLLYLLPTGYWISRLLTEAGSITATLATLCAVTVVLRNDWSQRARLTAVTLAAIGLVATILMRPSSGVLLAAAVGGASMLMLATELMRHRRVDRAVTSLAGVCVTVVVLWQVFANMLDLPGMRETVQDMFTRHFTQPDVPDPWLRLWEANREYWPSQIEGWLNGGVPLAAASVLAFLVATVYVVLRALPARDALVWLAVGTTGLVTVAVHPVWSEVDRLMIVIWLPLVVGLAMVARRRSTMEERAEPGVSRRPSTAGTS